MEGKALRAFISAREATLAAEKAEEAAFRKAFPLGSVIEWKHGQHHQTGRVVILGYGTRLLAENRNTGRRYGLMATRSSRHASEAQTGTARGRRDSRTQSIRRSVVAAILCVADCRCDMARSFNEAAGGRRRSVPSLETVGAPRIVSLVFTGLDSHVWRDTSQRSIRAMSIFGKLLKTALDVATVPVAIVKDVATLGGSVNDHGSTYTGDKLRQLERDGEEVRDELDNL